jgi:DegV family protein with EDD domain
MVKIIADTTSFLSHSFAEEFHITIIPQVIIFGEDSYYEGTEIDTDTFMQRLISSSELRKTAAPPPELYSREFDRLSSSTDTILCIHPSSEVSGTVRSSTVAAKDFPEMDIRSISRKGKLTFMNARERINEH